MDNISHIRMELGIQAQRIISELSINNDLIKDQLEKGIQLALEDIKSSNFVELVRQQTKVEIQKILSETVISWELKNKLKSIITEKLEAKISEYADQIVESVDTNTNQPGIKRSYQKVPFYCGPAESEKTQFAETVLGKHHKKFSGNVDSIHILKEIFKSLMFDSIIIEWPFNKPDRYQDYFGGELKNMIDSCPEKDIIIISELYPHESIKDIVTYHIFGMEEQE